MTNSDRVNIAGAVPLAHRGQIGVGEEIAIAHQERMLESDRQQSQHQLAAIRLDRPHGIGDDQVRKLTALVAHGLVPLDNPVRHARQGLGRGAEPGRQIEEPYHAAVWRVLLVRRMDAYGLRCPL